MKVVAEGYLIERDWGDGTYIYQAPSSGSVYSTKQKPQKIIDEIKNSGCKRSVRLVKAKVVIEE